MTIRDDLATRGDERIPEIVRAWERAQAVMPPANPTDPDDPNTALATLAAIAHAKWRRAEAAEAEVARLDTELSENDRLVEAAWGERDRETEKAQAAEAEIARLRDGLRWAMKEFGSAARSSEMPYGKAEAEYAEQRLRALLSGEDGAA